MRVVTHTQLRTGRQIIFHNILIDGDEKGPWCYTTNPRARFDYCDIPKCTEIPTTPDNGGNVGQVTSATCWNKGRGGYLGTVSKTRRGKTCQEWCSNTPHKPKFRPDDDTHNYCRNPGTDTIGF